jgi:hypothetical protein
MISTPQLPRISPTSKTSTSERLGDENTHARLAMEVARLAEDNEDLRESARIWIWLYEKQLDRANRAVAELRALASSHQDPAA